MSTTDLVARLRGIIAAKPPHVTVLADNEEVYPIRVELLRETADAIESGHEANVNCNRNVDHLVARLAAAERVLQDLLDAFVAMPDAGLTDADPRHDWWLRTVQFRDLARNFLGSEKAYLQDRKTSRDAELTPGVRNASADVAGTPEQFKQWVLDDLKDPKNFAELKSRSDEANAKMAARPFTDDSNPTGAAGGNILGKAWRDKRLDRADKAPDLNISEQTDAD